MWLGAVPTVQPTFTPESRHRFAFNRKPYSLGVITREVWMIVRSDLLKVASQTSKEKGQFMIRQSAILLALVLASQLSARAATVAYTFESPVFALGESTPSLTNRAPNIGSPSFLASFVSGGSTFTIGNDPNLPNGMSLVESG